MSNDLMRFSVAMPEDLLVRFDRLVARRGLAKNRSEVVRDLVRDALVEEECATPGAEVMGTLTIVFDHHASDLQEKLHAIQHEYFESIVSSMHVHLDEHNCLEVIVLRGGKVAQGVANHQHMARRIALGRKRRKAGLLGACVLAQNDVHMLDKAVARPFFRQSLAVGAGNNGGVRQHMDRRQGLSAAGKRPRIIAHGGDGRVDGAAPFQRFLQARAAAGRNGFLQRRV